LRTILPLADFAGSDMKLGAHLHAGKLENIATSGQKGQVTVDSVGDKQFFDGAVNRFNQQANSLLAMMQTREERVHQVFGVKIVVMLRRTTYCGMAADVYKLLVRKKNHARHTTPNE